jgi:LacI family transcriptional regulator
VINGTRAVAPETREKVLLAMRELDYHGNADARRLARGRGDFLGLIISDIENPFYPGLIKAFESAAIERGFEVLLCTTNYDPSRSEKAIRMMIENKSPGVAVMTSRVDPALATVLEGQGVASVMLDSGSIGRLRSDIRLNYAKGAGEAVQYLWNLGHRKFAFIAGPQDRPSHVAYRQAVESALRELGVRPGVIEGKNSVESGELAAERLLTRRDPPTAILCSNDMTAIGAMRGLSRSGIRIPADVSIVGADDIAFAALTSPPLTTVQIPPRRLGELACEILAKMLGEGRIEGRQHVLDTGLVIRESTRSVAKPSSEEGPADIAPQPSTKREGKTP